MKIRKLYTNFTGIVDVGRFAYFIDVGREGVYYSEEDIFEKCREFKNVVVEGEIDDEYDNVKTLIKKLLKFNEEIKIFVYATSSHKSLSLNTTTNINILLKHTSLPMEKRINTKSMSDYKHLNANYIFNIFSEDDVDEAIGLISTYELNKNRVYLTTSMADDIDKVKQFAKTYGFNFCPDFKLLLWSE